MPAGITIVGLGPGDSHHWTLAAQRTLLQANEVYVRSAQHPAITDISAPVHSLDQKFLQAEEIAREIVQLGHRDQGVVYAVPGNPVLDDASVPFIRSMATEDRLPVSIIPGLSILDAVITALGLESLDGKAWKEWLRLSNWLAICDPERVTARTLLTYGASAPSIQTNELELSAEWQQLFDEAVSDAERDLIRALASAGASAPELGYETADGDVLDMAWASGRVAVVFEHGASVDGWTLCAPDINEIVEALKLNGVV